MKIGKFFAIIFFLSFAVLMFLSVLIHIDETFTTPNFNSKTVKIVDKYTERKGKAIKHYMVGEDSSRNQYKISGQSKKIGDVLTIYMNPDAMSSLGDEPIWYVSKLSYHMSTITSFMSGVLAVIFFIGLAIFIKKKK